MFEKRKNQQKKDTTKKPDVRKPTLREIEAFFVEDDYPLKGKKPNEKN